MEATCLSFQEVCSTECCLKLFASRKHVRSFCVTLDLLQPQRVWKALCLKQLRRAGVEPWTPQKQHLQPRNPEKTVRRLRRASFLKSEVSILRTAQRLTAPRCFQKGSELDRSRAQDFPTNITLDGRFYVPGRPSLFKESCI